MKNRKRFLLNLAMAMALYIGLPGIAAACGCQGNSSWGFETGQYSFPDDDYVYTFASLALSSYECDGWVAAEVRAPDNTYVWNSADNSNCEYCNSVFVAAWMPIGTQDGTFVSTAQYYAGDLGLFTIQATQTIPPFIRISNTTLSLIVPPPLPPCSPNQVCIQVGDGRAAFKVQVMTSPGCSGGVTLIGQITHPNDMQIKIDSGGPPGNFASSSFVMDGGTSREFNYTIATTPENQEPGSVTAESYFDARPCVESGSRNTSKTLTVGGE